MDARDQLERLCRIADDHGLDTIVLSDPASLAWLTGARCHVQHDLHTSAFDLVASQLRSDAPRLTVVTTVIEAERLRRTELAGAGAPWDYRVTPWPLGRASALPSGPGVGSDVADPGRTDVSGDVAHTRRTLNAERHRLLTALVRDAADAVGAAVRGVRPGDRELDLAASVTAALVRGGMEPVLCLVGSGPRLETDKHPLPLDLPLQDRLMVSVSARRHGLLAAITRYAVLGTLAPADSERYRRLLNVEAALLQRSRAGASLGAVFADGVATYGLQGFDPDAWAAHHQGGLTGFRPRTCLATSTSTEVLLDGEAIAWNPSAEGWKVESTSLVTPGGAVPLDVAPHWPQIDVAGRTRPGVLDLRP